MHSSCTRLVMKHNKDNHSSSQYGDEEEILSLLSDSHTANSAASQDRGQPMLKRQRFQKCFNRAPWIVSCLLSLILVYAFVSGSKNTSINPLRKLNDISTYSPAQHLIELQNVVFTGGFAGSETIYQGASTPEKDRAWENLYSFGITRIPMDSAAKLVNKTVPIPGDPGYYVVSLNVFHLLHCLNMIRKRIWSNEHYDPTHELMGIEHISHCVDALRQSLMCSVDISPHPWVWDYEAHQAKEVAEIQHTCRNFEKVKQWAKENRVNNFDTKVFVEDPLRT